MKCPNCGLENPDTSKFCGGCGTRLVEETDSLPEEKNTVAPEAETATEAAPEAETAAEAAPEAETTADVPEAETPASETAAEAAPEAPAEKKQFNFKLPAIIGGAVAALIIIGIVIVKIVLGTPLHTLAIGLSNSFKAAQNSEIAETLTSLIEHGSVSVDVDGEELSESLGFYEIDGKANLTLYTNAEDTRIGVTAELNAADSKIVDAIAWAGADSVGVSSDIILGDNSYGINLKKLKTNLPKSIFNPANDSDYALPASVYDALMDLDGAENTIEELTDDAKALLKEAASELEKALKQNAEVSKSTEKIAFNGDELKVTAVTVSAEDDELFEIIKYMAEWLKDSDKAHALTEELSDQLNDMAYDYLGLSLDDLSDSVFDGIDNYYWLEDMLDDCSISVDFYISKSGKQFIGFDLALELYGEKTKFSLLCGPDLEAPEMIYISMKDDTEKISAQYTVNERSSKAYEASFKLKDNSETLLSGKISWDKKSGELEASIEDVSVSAVLEQSGSKFVFNLDSLSSSGLFGSTYEIDNSGTVITVDTNAKFMTIPDYEDILSYTDETELEDLVDEIRNSIQELVFEFLFG